MVLFLSMNQGIKPRLIHIFLILQRVTEVMVTFRGFVEREVIVHQVMFTV